MAQLYGVWQGTVQDQLGAVVPNAAVSVHQEGTGELLQLYADRAGVTGLGNPTTTDEEGFVQFYCKPCRIQIIATSGSFSREHNDVIVIEEYAGSLLVEDATDARTLSLDDNGATIRFTGDDPITVTVPDEVDVNFPPFSTIYLMQSGNGVVSVTSNNAIVNCAENFARHTAGANAVIAVRKIAADEWVLVGQLDAA
jgi:hypothetical protein